jgi:EAL domain-containing protein (putative c-di-GMP-specific phosphodiesterase class I)/GGDEF domain-containing protein
MDIVEQRTRQEAELAELIDGHITKADQGQEKVAAFALELRGTARLRAHPGGTQAERLIREIHQKVLNTLRPDDKVAFLNDAQILLAMPGLKNPGHARLAVRRLLHELNNYRDEQGFSVRVAPLIGVALWPDVAASGDELLSKAGLAVDMAINSQQDFYFYSPSLERQKLQSWNIVQEVERALRADEFSIHYQPQINLTSGELSGVEALIRWHHPVHGELSPSAFIPLVEHSNAIQPLTRWCLHTALRQFKDLPPQSQPLTVSVNISSRNLAEPGFGEMVTNSIMLWGMPPGQLTLEVTEGALLEDIDYATAVLDDLREQGIRISIDDFGTGYSSLSYLRQLPVDELKIDQSFVRNILTERHDRNIVETIIKIAKDFDFSLVAEGIEQDAALKLLGEMGCEIGQGYAISRPMAHGQLCDWIHTQGK